MAQHDGVIDNGTGNAVRTDINNALAAINSNNSGASDPSTTYAYQFYADTGDNTFKIRNAANDGFINISITGGLGTENFGLAPLSGATFTGTVKLNDNVKAVFGTGDDLEIYHDGTDSYLDNPTGITRIRNTGTNGSQIQLLNNNQGIKIQGKTAEQSITAIANGAVELYHDNSKKIETTSSGVLVDNQIKMSDAGALVIGTDNDVNINHSGSHFQIHNDTGNIYLDTVGTHFIRVGSGNEAAIDAIADGAVNLYYDNSLKFETTSTGVKFTGTLEAIDNQSILLGTGSDLRIRHTSSHSEITDEGTGDLRLGSNQVVIGSPTFDETSAKFIDDGAVELYFDNAKKAETVSGGFTVTGTCTATAFAGDGSALTGISAGGVGGNTGIDFNDDIAIRFGTGNDISLDFDSGTNAFNLVCSNAASILLDSDDDITLRCDDNILFQTDGTTTQAFFSSAGLELVDDNTGVSEDGTTTNVIKFHDTDTTVASNQVIGRIDYEGSDSSGAGVVARIQGQAGNTAGGGELSFKVAPSGTTTLAEAININSLGGVNIYNNLRLTSSTARLMGVATGTGYAVLRQREAHGTNGGSFSNGADRVRILNVVEHDNDGGDYSGKEFVTLDTGTGEFTLEAGAYLIFFQAQAQDCGDHRAKITNDAGTTLITGDNAFSNTAYNNTTISQGWGRVNNSSSEGYFLKHRCQTSKTTTGFGRDSNFGSELEFYAQVIIFREGAAT